MKTQAMRRFVHIDADDSKPPNKAKQFAVAAGHAAESVALRLPIIGRVISRIPTGVNPSLSALTRQHHSPTMFTDAQGRPVRPGRRDTPPPRGSTWVCVSCLDRRAAAQAARGPDGPGVRALYQVPAVACEQVPGRAHAPASPARDCPGARRVGRWPLLLLRPLRPPHAQSRETRAQGRPDPDEETRGES